MVVAAKAVGVLFEEKSRGGVNLKADGDCGVIRGKAPNYTAKKNP